ncbi:hypothetical protein HYH03_012639 [Edaphochlamys debaryana]|uniref:Histone deacetylase domain-containing protein n=1 Tax=Edaphochlamys debaryana TaxID=47281 RepID=A0A835XSH2_9CHLO|nr:hypothetical protein HYH03_012639 [Edaphochlamys debaryana]|eukprot:KAG2488842.1 hypothetical protein HYH03_012639 [Edaphochlamys debaryana]
MFSQLAKFRPGALAASYRDLLSGAWPDSSKLPVVYHDSYNIRFLGLEKLHPFDSCKYAKVLAGLQKQGLLHKAWTVKPRQATLEVLADVHTQRYIGDIHAHPSTVAQVTELAPLACLPMCLLERFVLAPMRYHVGGTMLAAALALERGWAVNLGGGMHHAAADRGMGWCPFDDIVLAVRRARAAAHAADAASAGTAGAAAGADPGPASTSGPAAGNAGAGAGLGAGAGAASGPVAEGTEGSSGQQGLGSSGPGAGGRQGQGQGQAEGLGQGRGQGQGQGQAGERIKVLVIDLDAHQGNGVERDKLEYDMADFYILDAYNEGVFPADRLAKSAIDVPMPLRPLTPTATYLQLLDRALERAAEQLPRPDLVVYNAGTDVLEGDPLGGLAVSAAGVIQRDERVWRWCLETARCPVLMLLSGGYAPESAAVITASLANLFRTFRLGMAPPAGE